MKTFCEVVSISSGLVLCHFNYENDWMNKWNHCFPIFASPSHPPTHDIIWTVHHGDADTEPKNTDQA